LIQHVWQSYEEYFAIPDVVVQLPIVIISHGNIIYLRLFIYNIFHPGPIWHALRKRQSMGARVIIMISFLLSFTGIFGAQAQFQTAEVDTQNGYYLSEIFAEIWDGADWINDYQVICTYGDNGNLTKEVEQRWDGSI
jgi:hypothetical protein